MPGCFRSGHLLGAARLAPPYKGIRRAEEALTSYSCSPVVGRSALRLNSQFRLTKIQSAVFLGAIVRRHRVMFQQNPLKGCRTMFAFAGLKVVLGILLIGSRPSCSPGCGEYFEICTRQPALFYPVVVFLIALRWIYLGVMFYRKIGTGPLVVALPPLARVVVCDEDEESPQAHRK